MRCWIQRTEKALEDASSDIYAAATLLGSVEELAFCGGAFGRWDPLPSIHRLLDTAIA